MPESEMLKAFFPDIRNKTRTSPITASIQHYTQDTGARGQGKRTIILRTGKEEINPSIFSDDRIVYIENIKESKSKL